MAEINIYILLDQYFHKTFPKLIEAIIKNGHRVKILCNDITQMKTLDSSLWSFASLAFIPHATEEDEHLSDQPALLTTIKQSNPNNSDVLVLFNNFLDNVDIDNYKKNIFILNQDSIFDYEQFKHFVKNKENLSYQLITQTAESKWRKEKS